MTPWEKMELEKLKDEGFNEGSDARIAGRVPTDNPYIFNDPRFNAWNRGWGDVDLHWGTWAKELGWKVKPLKNLRPSRR